ncbi:DNA polymerase III subunit delta [Sphingobacterium sp. SG20118]|uniref:DNA polymerase III subunit delta n=1 Tax=Sphingobacterium TaxID=28453 RepID=UPI0004F84C9E|nr:MULTISPECIES: DNA polymerase III subunit delta [Sphingobacterium]AIM36527.1 DNA polymerase III subunit delta [Sphingobacterium sp. ML3W]MDH5827297.1 DNA polymerase III subunit delta [Sphingobacterium faecium]
MNISPILADIKKRKFQPVYLLHGEESYFIDVISNALEHTVLNDAQKGFDQTILYGKDTDFSTIVSAARRYPMMSDHQLIIIKEAQDLKWKDDDLLLKYVDQCTATTVLVFDYKYSKFDKRKKLYKAIEKKGLVVESNKLYDDKVAAWVISYIKEQGWSIHPQAAALLSEYLGTELSKIVNELNKLMLNVPKEKEIVVADIEQNIGISKDFNVFELNTALAKRNAFKAYQIIDYFAANPKSNPLVLVLGNMAGYFTKILKYHYIVDKNTAAKELGVHPFFLKEYELAARNYNRRKTFSIIENLKDADLKSKGVQVGSNTNTKDILTELLFNILN